MERKLRTTVTLDCKGVEEVMALYPGAPLSVVLRVAVSELVERHKAEAAERARALRAQIEREIRSAV